MNELVLRSKKVKAAVNVPELKLRGVFNISGTRPARDGEPAFMMVQLQGFGLDAWLRVSKPLPRVEGASAVLLQGRIGKTKTKAFAVQPIALLGVEIDGDIVWQADPVEDSRQDDDSTKQDAAGGPTAAKRPAAA